MLSWHTDIFIQVNNYSMKPLEEYMLFTNTGAENITVINSQGVRSAQCSMEFDITQKFVPEPSLNFSVVIIFWIIYICARPKICIHNTQALMRFIVMNDPICINTHQIMEA